MRPQGRTILINYDINAQKTWLEGGSYSDFHSEFKSVITTLKNVERFLYILIILCCKIKLLEYPHAPE